MKYLSRILIIFLWIFLIGIAFYLPNWKTQLPPEYDKSLNLFIWGDTLDEDILQKFEKETGIKIHLNFYNSNEELRVKMQATRGEGYDLIMPSDYAVAQLIKDDLLQPIDHNKFQHWDILYPFLINKDFDPQNRYSLPFEWEIYGFLINPEFFKSRTFPNTWRAVFDENFIDYPIVMKNDPIEVFQFAAYYLFGPLKSVNSKQLSAIRQLLVKQHKWVAAYSDFRGDYYIGTGTAPLAISTTSYIQRIRNHFPNIRLVIPQEGSFVTIENFCIPKASRKQEYAYTFLNYIYQRESLIKHHKTYFFFPPSDQILDQLELTEDLRKLFEIKPEEFGKYQFFRPLIPQSEIQDLWVQVKSF